MAQNSPLKIIVRWPNESYEQKVEVYNTANDLILTLCDDTQCYTTTQIAPDDRYSVKYDLGCVPNGVNYYLKLYDAGNNGWNGGRVKVKIDGTEVVNDTGSGANTAGQTIFFDVSGGDAKCSSIPDLDQDGIGEYLDYDDDGWEDWEGVWHNFPNWREEEAKTNPWNPDSDGDGMSDGFEADN